MRLIRLELNNFRSYASGKIEFSDDQNYIFGKNWQGKSSIMDGIGYALFGKHVFPSKLAGSSIRSEHFVREGSKSGWVELEFEHRDNNYMIKRHCPKDYVKFYCNNEEIANGITPVKEKLQELIGIDTVLFANVFYSEQDDLRRILELKSEERKVFIETILGFDFLKEVKLAAGRTSNSLKTWLDGFLSGDVKTIIELNDTTYQDIKRINSEISELQERIKKLGDPKETIRKEKGKVESISFSYDTALEQSSLINVKKDIYIGILNGISTGICPTCNQTISSDNVTVLKHQFEHLLRELDAKLSAAKEKLDIVDQELEEANEKLEFTHDKDAEFRELKQELKDLKDNLTRQEDLFQSLQNKINAYGNKTNVINLVDDECQFLNELQKAIDEFRTNLRGIVAKDLENGVNYFMSQFSDGDFDAQLIVEEDFSFKIMLHDKPVPLFNLSGAARDILALSIRYGLYQIASKEINFILLDEPTRHFDQGNTIKLKDALNELTDQQLIVITVHDEFYDAIGKKFLIEKDTNLQSTINEL